MTEPPRSGTGQRPAAGRPGSKRGGAPQRCARPMPPRRPGAPRGPAQPAQRAKRPLFFHGERPWCALLSHYSMSSSGGTSISSETYFPFFFRWRTHSVSRYSICPFTERKSSSAQAAMAAYSLAERRRGSAFSRPFYSQPWRHLPGINRGCRHSPQAGPRGCRRGPPTGWRPWRPCAPRPVPPCRSGSAAPGPSPRCPRPLPRSSSGRR